MGPVGDGRGDYVHSSYDDLSFHGSNGGLNGFGSNSVLINGLGNIVGAPVTSVLAAVWCSRQGRV